MFYPKMYCLTCREIPWRNKDVQQRFDQAGLPVEMFYGVHGATVGLACTLAHIDSPGHFISSGKMAITISKMLLWQKIVQSPEPFAIVFENDVTFVENFWDEFIKSFAALPADWEVVHIGHCCGDDKPTTVINDRISEIRHPFCCHAIMWKKEAAAIALETFKHTSWGTPSDIMLAELVYPKLRHYSFTPQLAFQDQSLSEAASVGRWDQIQGWFDFDRIYNEALDRVRCPSVFVEVGSWLGRSTAYMAEEIKRRYKPVQFFTVDTWEGSTNEPPMQPIIEAHNGDLFPQWQRNMSRAGVIEYVIPVKMASVEAAKLFKNHSVDFIFIDGDHSFEMVSADIEAWRPKLKPSGVMAGHDIDRESVRNAVERHFPGRFRTWERCWIVDP